MRACLYIGPGCNEWCWEFFPSKSPGELAIAGKSWCRHLVDQCSHLDISDIYIADCYYYDDLPRRMGDGDYWCLKLHYLPTVPCALPEQLIKQHQEEISTDDDLLIVWGQVMPDVTDMKELFSELREVKEMPGVLPDGIWLLRSGKLYECVCPLLRMRNLQEYFELNFQLLKKPGIYNLPGYSNNEGCVFGMDVMILPGCELQSPVLIQDDVRLERNVVLSDDVIVGKGVLINEGTCLEHSIVMDHTFIGKHMFFRNKIIDGVRIIDVPAEVCLDMEEKALTDSLTNRGINRYMLTEFILALVLSVGGLPLYVVTLPFRKWLDKLAFFNFGFQIYPKCWKVLAGKAHLVRYGRHDPEYVFRYSDQWVLHQDEHQKIMDDVYYYYNRSILKIWRTVSISLLKRLLILRVPPTEDRSNYGQEESE